MSGLGCIRDISFADVKNFLNGDFRAEAAVQITQQSSLSTRRSSHRLSATMMAVVHSILAEPPDPSSRSGRYNCPDKGFPLIGVLIGLLPTHSQPKTHQLPCIHRRRRVRIAQSIGQLGSLYHDHRTLGTGRRTRTLEVSGLVSEALQSSIRQFLLLLPGAPTYLGEQRDGPPLLQVICEPLSPRDHAYQL